MDPKLEGEVLECVNLLSRKDLRSHMVEFAKGKEELVSLTEDKFNIHRAQTVSTSP